MKRFFATAVTVLLVLIISFTLLSLLITSLFTSKDPILASLPAYSHKEYYTCGGFQDYTDYAKYTYRITVTDFTQNPYFLRVTEKNIPKILSYIEDFEKWVECEDFPTEAYDFDPSMVKEGDYFYILNKYDDPDKEFYNYNVYYFNLDTQVLYYFHNNI